jgi:hypothetical protein
MPSKARHVHVRGMCQHAFSGRSDIHMRRFSMLYIVPSWHFLDVQWIAMLKAIISRLNSLVEVHAPLIQDYTCRRLLLDVPLQLSLHVSHSVVCVCCADKTAQKNTHKMSQSGAGRLEAITEETRKVQ